MECISQERKEDIMNTIGELRRSAERRAATKKIAPRLSTKPELAGLPGKLKEIVSLAKNALLDIDTGTGPPIYWEEARAILALNFVSDQALRPLSSCGERLNASSGNEAGPSHAESSAVWRCTLACVSGTSNADG